MSYTCHACGLFEIASYRIEQTLFENTIQGIASSSEKSSITMCQGVINGFNMYRKAIEFFSQLITSKKYYEMIVSFVFISGHFWYMFFCNYVGQKMMDHSSDIQRAMIYSSVKNAEIITAYDAKKYATLHNCPYWFIHSIARGICHDFDHLNFNCLITMFIYVSIFCIILVQFLSNFFFNTTSDKNESGLRQLPILVECFIDQQKYFLLILILLCFIVICSLTMVIATETVNMSYVQHACGLFEIARYNVQWYVAPLKTQKLLLLMMQRSMRHCTIVIDGLFIPSFEGFATVRILTIASCRNKEMKTHTQQNINVKQQYLKCRENMVFAGSRYYKINRILLMCIGLWPYYTQQLMEQMRYDWNSLKKKEEFKIIQNRTNIGRFCTIIMLSEFIDSVKSTFSVAHIFASSLGVILLSINLYLLCEYIMAEDIYGMSTSFLYIVTHFCYMFFLNYIGQQVIDYSNNIFKKTYNSRWYAAPLNTQKCLIIITYRSMKTYTLTICLGLFVPSLEGFATVNYYLSFDLRNSSRNLRSLSAFSAGLVKYALFHRKPPSSYPLCNKCAVVLVSFNTLKKEKGNKIPKELLLQKHYRKYNTFSSPRQFPKISESLSRKIPLLPHVDWSRRANYRTGHKSGACTI
ncbi:hypothetical protein ALC53_04739 [Atta colombica]|uniref:Uncharacterized protein n=1 Tax=Atta colombica TaxID=520822 RepID=A0A195BLA8_9HYME|nr:hypothetical protein ALC53_04739 [Atta colombica]